MSWVVENKEWLFSGAGVVLLVALVQKFWARLNAGSGDTNPLVNVVNNNNFNHPPQASVAAGPEDASESRLAKTKAATRVLFIDDDTKFKVVKIFKSSGWIQTSLVKDVSSISNREVLEADVIFVDVQGVGVLLGFRDEGLGLAGALKDRYPNKKVVIYSSEPKGAMFHQALRKADGSLEKYADPYEFEQMLERLVGIE